MRILASFPIYGHPDVTERAIKSLASVDTFFVVNNEKFGYLVKKLPHVVNKKNNYCNGAWNQAMRYFLKGDWDCLLLSSNDVVMKADWASSIHLEPGEVLLPGYSPTLTQLHNWYPGKVELSGQPAGACTLLPRAAVEVVYPIPRSLKLWFGDEYMYRKLRANGWRLTQGNFAAYHYGQLDSLENPDIPSVIEADKVAWEKVKI